MKPTGQQLKTLQNYLHKTLTYRETYEEVYDHILSAADHQPDNMPFEDIINNIIRNDFGSPANLLKIERANKKALVKECLKEFTGYFADCFKFPSLLFTIGFAIAVHYFFLQMKLDAFTVECLFAVLVIIPGLIYFMRLYNTGYLLDTIQKSAKDKLFETLCALPLRIFVVLTIWVNTSFYKMWQSADYYSITVLLLLGVIYTITLYKLYRNEFKKASVSQ